MGAERASRTSGVSGERQNVVSKEGYPKGRVLAPRVKENEQRPMRLDQAETIIEIDGRVAATLGMHACGRALLVAAVLAVALLSAAAPAAVLRIETVAGTGPTTFSGDC